MTDYIEWHSRLFRREAIDYAARYGDKGIVVVFASGQDRRFNFDDPAERDRYLTELVQKVQGTWLEDTKPPQDGTETGPGGSVVQSWGEITVGSSWAVTEQFRRVMNEGQG